MGALAHTSSMPPQCAAPFVVRDYSGQRLAYIYFEDKPGR
jgi:hypothetical protein